MLRGVLSVIAGFAIWTVLWLGATNGLVAAMPDSFNPDGFTASVGILSAMLALSVAVSVLSGYLTSAIAHARSLKPVWALGAILQILV